LENKKRFNAARMRHYAGRLMSAMDGGYGYCSFGSDFREPLWPTCYVMVFYCPRVERRKPGDNPAAIAVTLFGGAQRKKGRVETACTRLRGLYVRAKYQGKDTQVLVAIGSSQATAAAMK